MNKIKTQFLRGVLYIGKGFLNFIYFFIKLLPTKNKITMLSRQSNKINLDFKLIYKEIVRRDKCVEVKVLCKTIKHGWIDRFIYCFHIISAMYHIATSRVCIIDGYSIPISILKHKEELEIIQIWHASGAIKKFGFQTLNKKEGRGTGVAKALNMHRNYSHILAPSTYTAKHYAEAFGVDESKIIIGLLPRIDYICSSDNKKNEFFNRYPQFKNKKTILYVPTFRKNEELELSDLIKNVNTKKYNLIIRLHPLDKTIVDKKFLVDKSYNTYDLLKIADYVITDYSAIAFESCVIDKPLYFYIKDIERYRRNRGVNVDLFKEMPNATSKDIRRILKSIENEDYDFNELYLFREKYMGNNKNNATNILVDFIFRYLEVENDYEIEKDANRLSETKLNI